MDLNKLCMTSELFQGHAIDNNSEELIVGIFPNEVIKSSNNTVIFCQKYLFIYNILRHIYKIRIRINVADSDEGGQLLGNGSWTGAMKLIIDNMADFFMTIFIYDENRLKHLEYPYLWYNRRTVAILSSPVSYRSDNWVAIWTSFTANVWLAILLSYLTLWAINCVSVTQIKNCFSSALDYFSVLLGKSIILKSGQKKGLLIIWLLSSITLSTYFQSNIRSLLVSIKESRIESLTQLKSRSDINIIVKKNTFTHKFIANTYPSLMERTETINHLQTFDSRLIDKVLDHRHVFVGYTSVVRNLRDYYFQSNLIETGDDIAPYFSGFMLRQNLNQHLKTKLTKLIFTIYRNGLLLFHIKREVTFYKQLFKYKNSSEYPDIVNPSRPVSKVLSHKHICINGLTASDLKFAFISAFIGLCFASTSLVIEISMRTFNRIFRASLSRHKVYLPCLSSEHTHISQRM